ncbi:helix-turn-helix domain-containing protein [Sinomicrobium pectinilyticum]|nr:helix-turn-helix domain-containing protein [Sinomicrobium pectinilyticum]
MPFIISSIFHIGINIFYYSVESYPAGVKLFYVLEEYLAFIYAALLGVLSFRKLKNAIHINNKVNTKWLYNLLRVGLILCIVWVVIYSLAISFSMSGMKLYYPIWLGISILFYWISYRGLYQFRLAKDRKAVSLLLHEFVKNKSEEYHLGTDNYTQKNPIFSKLKKIIEEDHIYREQDLSLYSLSKKLKTNTSTLSRIVNEVSEKSFTDFINVYRIEEAKKILNDDAFFKYKISAIALEVGFNNYDTFCNAFKKYTGTTPGKYRESHMKRVKD